MALTESWHVRSRSRECAATGTAFEDGEEIITALYPDPESSGYLRRDFSLKAWNETLPGDETPPFSFWKTKYTAPVDKNAEKPEAKLSAEEILRRLVDEDEEHTENTRYILAVMLERQKLLRETDSQRTTGGIIRIYEHRKSGEVFLVRDPDIPLDQIESVQEEVSLMLEHNGRLPEKAEESDVDEEQTAAPAEGDSDSDPEDEPTATGEDPEPQT